MSDQSLDTPLDAPLDTLLAAFSDAFNARDARSLASLFVEDGELVNILGMRMVGRGGIEAGHARHFATALAGSHLAFTGRTVRRLRPDVAVLVATWHRGTLPGAAAGTMPPGDGVLTFVAVESAGEWRLATAHNTQVAQPPAAPRA